MYRGIIEIANDLIPLNACLVTSGHKCGKKNCRCSRGYLHQATSLKYRVNGVQKKKYVRKSEVAAVKRLLYWTKGGQFFERADKYTIAIFYKYPNLARNEYPIKAYEIFGQQKQQPESLLAN